MRLKGRQNISEQCDPRLNWHTRVTNPCGVFLVTKNITELLHKDPKHIKSWVSSENSPKLCKSAHRIYFTLKWFLMYTFKRKFAFQMGKGNPKQSIGIKIDRVTVPEVGGRWISRHIKETELVKIRLLFVWHLHLWRTCVCTVRGKHVEQSKLKTSLCCTEARGLLSPIVRV